MNPELNPTVSAAPAADDAEAKNAPVPIWFIVLASLLVYWGAIYFDQNSGWFDPHVYTPYRDYNQVAEMRPPSSGPEELLRKGKSAFAVCAVCHMDNGMGNPGNGCPPLAGSEWVKAPGAGRIVRIVSKGLMGPIQVKGQNWGTGVMLPIGDQLPGDERQKCEQIAAIVSYVRDTFGDHASPVTPEQVRAIREEIKGRTTSFEVKDLLQVPEDK